MIKARIRWCSCRAENILTLGKLQCCQVYDFIRTFTEFTVFVRSTENDCKCTEVSPFSFIILLVIKGKRSTALEVKVLLQASPMDDSSTSAEGPVPQGPECPAPKRKCLDSGRGKFKYTWKLPEGIGSSSKGAKYAFCKYYICIAHGGFNDVTRRVSGKTHNQRLHDIHSTPTLTTFASSTQNQSHKVMLAEVIL